MRFNSILISGTFLLIIFFTGCKKDHFISANQQMLFQYDYKNNAWGIQHNGFLIDNKGNILAYHNPENWNHHDNSYTLTKRQVTENFQKCELSAEKIPSEELHKYSNYIRKIALSKISARRNVAKDAGTAEFICFQYSESTDTYEGHLIKMEGDFTCENLNFYSKKVATWMRDIEYKINRK
jgi:hypothetical protein